MAEQVPAPCAPQGLRKAPWFPRPNAARRPGRRAEAEGERRLSQTPGRAPQVLRLPSRSPENHLAARSPLGWCPVHTGGSWGLREGDRGHLPPLREAARRPERSPLQERRRRRVGSPFRLRAKQQGCASPVQAVLGTALPPGRAGCDRRGPQTSNCLCSKFTPDTYTNAQNCGATSVPSSRAYEQQLRPHGSARGERQHFTPGKQRWLAETGFLESFICDHIYSCHLSRQTECSAGLPAYRTRTRE